MIDPSTWLAQAVAYLSHPIHLSVWLTIFALLLAKAWPARPAVRPVLVALSLILCARYLYWRFDNSLNRVNVWAYGISVTLITAEIFGGVSMFLFYLQSMWPRSRNSVPYTPSEAPSVDAMITIYNEPEALLYRTLTAAAAMDYPAGKLKLYVLDDGNRDSVKALAKRFGAGYITRRTNEDAKAGNINNALPITKGEIIVLFDCDHLPVRTFLKETIGFFKDAKVAIVQTPHNFYNSDTFQRNLFMDRKLRNEQELFYNVLMPGRDRFNSAFFCGTSGLIRRSALMEVGGFRVTSLIEDLYTSMEIHAHGWKSVFYNKPLTGALLPESFTGHLRQHMRWTRGGVQIFVRDNPLLKPGLSLMQRLHYLGSLLYFFHGLPRIVYLLAPLPFLYLNITPIAAPTLQVFAYFLPYFVATQAAFGMMTRRFRNPWWSDVYETADAFSLAGSAVEALLLPEKILFQVTPKVVSVVTERTRWSHILPHITTAGLLVGGLAITAIRTASGQVLSDAALLSLIWTVYNVLLLTASIAAGRERPRVRLTYRLPRRLRCRLQADGKTFTGWTHDVSESGTLLMVHGEGPLPESMSTHVRCFCGNVLETRGTVTWQKPFGKNGIMAGVRFEDMDDGKVQTVTRLMFSCPRSWARMHRPNLSFRASLGAMLTAFEEAFEIPDPEKARTVGVWSGKK